MACVLQEEEHEGRKTHDKEEMHPQHSSHSFGILRRRSFFFFWSESSMSDPNPLSEVSSSVTLLDLTRVGHSGTAYSGQCKRSVVMLLDLIRSITALSEETGLTFAQGSFSKQQSTHW